MRSLVVGYGNTSRRDDGVALQVINGLRARWGQPPLDPEAEIWGELEGVHDSIFVQQLTLELSSSLVWYSMVVFVDAGLPQMEAAVRVEQVTPNLRPTAISHHMEPAVLLALADGLVGRAPAGWLVSVRGHDFDFGEALSAETAATVREAVERVAALIAAAEAEEGGRADS